MTGFCGGMSRTGELCGALTGGIAAIGLLHGRDQVDDDKTRCYTPCYQPTKQFETHCGSRNCARVNPLDISTTAGTKRFMQEKMGEKICPEIAVQTTEIVQGLLLEKVITKHPLLSRPSSRYSANNFEKLYTCNLIHKLTDIL